MHFDRRVDHLPILGIGLSTEHGAAAAPGALDPCAVRRSYPTHAAFLEVGVEVVKGLDEVVERWLAARLPTTYHFLDVNLDEPEDLDRPWLDSVAALAARLEPAWLCGDAGLWHFGPRERGHMLLLPPILCDDAADSLAAGIVALRSELGREVLPENPPGTLFLGDRSLLDFYARVLERADTGMLLDCAHLAMYQRSVGRDPLAGLDRFPLERVVELHVAGGRPFEHRGLSLVEDDHSPRVLDDTWTIFEHVVSRAPALRAVVLECERNPHEACRGLFERVEQALAGGPLGALG